MEIKLNSKLFKEIFNSETAIFKEPIKDFYLNVYDDENVTSLTSEEEMIKALEDYTNILSRIPNVSDISFSCLPPVLLNAFMQIKLPNKLLGIYNTTIDFETIDNVRDGAIEHLETIYFSALKSPNGQRSRFKYASDLKSLKRLSLFDCEALDLDSFFEEIPFPENLELLNISNYLPSPEAISKFSNIKELHIQGIQDSKALYDFLNSISIENIEEIFIIDCNFENVPKEFFARFTSLTSFVFTNNHNISYSDVLSELSCKEKLNVLSLVASNEQEDIDTHLDVKLLSQYTELIKLNINRLSIDFNELGKYLASEKNLSYMCLSETRVQNLDFLAHARTGVEFEFCDDDIDFSILTPEIASKYLIIGLSDSSKSLKTVRNGESEIDNDFNLILNLKTEQLQKIKSLMESSKNISATVEITDSITPITEFLFPYREKLQEGYTVKVSDFSKVDLEKLETLNQDEKLKSLIVLDQECDDINIPYRFTYTPEQYIQLKEVVEKITSDIPDDLTDLQKFMVIYRRLGAKISYDYGIVGDNKYSKYANDNVNDSRNCVNGLLRNTCVCAGYADILYNCLRQVGITAYKISGIAGEYHQWNQVELDGVTYNVDLTWDVSTLAKGRIEDLRYCLIGDEEFSKSHNAKNGKKSKCLVTYNRKQVKKALKFAMEFDHVTAKEKPGYISRFTSYISGLFKSNDKLALSAPIEEKNDIKGNIKSKQISWELDEESEKMVKKQMLDISNNHNVSNLSNKYNETSKDRD